MWPVGQTLDFDHGRGVDAEKRLVAASRGPRGFLMSPTRRLPMLLLAWGRVKRGDHDDTFHDTNHLTEA
jgi:hypothetical protein